MPSVRVVAVIATVSVPLSVPFIYLRYLLGSIFVLYLPGSTLIEILYPRKKELSQIERVTLSIAISLTLLPLIALLLCYTPFGVRLSPVLFLMSLLSIGLGLGAVKRKYDFLQV